MNFKKRDQQSCQRGYQRNYRLSQDRINGIRTGNILLLCMLQNHQSQACRKKRSCNSVDKIYCRKQLMFIGNLTCRKSKKAIMAY